MKKLMVLILILFTTTAFAQTYTVEQGVDGSYGQSLTNRIVSLVKPLHHNSWAGWATGTEVTFKFLEGKQPGQDIRYYSQSDMTYKVVEKDKYFVRLQGVGGKLSEQKFSITNEMGIPMAAEFDKGIKTKLEIDGSKIDCVLSESSLVTFIKSSSHKTVTKQWVLSDHPEILIRKETNLNWWAITSVQTMKKIGKKEYPCVVVKERLQIPDGYVITTRYLNANVPGHLVEEIKEFYKVENQQTQSSPWLIQHQKAIKINII